MAACLGVSGLLQAEVRARAGSPRDRCHADETWPYTSFTMDHLLPLSLGRSTTADDLALPA